MSDSSYLNFTFPDGNNYTGIEHQTLLSLNVIELFAHIFMDGPISAINFLLIFRTSILHPNLKFILLCQSACIFLRAIGRTILNVGRIWLDNLTTSGPFLLRMLYYQSTYLRNLIIHMLVIERIWATICFKRYEAKRDCWFSCGWFLITFLIALFNVLSNLVFSKKMTMLFSLMTFVGTFVLATIEVIAFLFIRRYNERLYLTNISSLTEKYQLSENIRTAKQLMPCIFLHFVNILLGTTQSCLSHFNAFGTNRFYYDLVNGQLVFTTSTIISFFIELCMILCHPFLRRGLVQCWQNVKRCAKVRSYISGIGGGGSVAPANGECGGIDTTGSTKDGILLMNIHGEPLLQMEKTDDLQKEHFRQLNLAWV